LLHNAQMDLNRLHFTTVERRHPVSICSRPCARNESRHQTYGDPCCWACIACSLNQYLPSPDDCVDCPFGTRPSDNLTACVPLPEQYLNYESPSGIVAMAAAGLGVLATIYTVVIFVRSVVI